MSESRTPPPVESGCTHLDPERKYLFLRSEIDVNPAIFVHVEIFITQ